MPSRERKREYFERLEGLLESHSAVFLVSADNVGSNQMARVRIALRDVKGDNGACCVMGKNTMIRRCILNWLDKSEANMNSGYANLLPHIKGNIGLIFCTGAMSECKKIIEENVVPAPAKAGTMANVDVWVPAGPTGCDPSQTSYFQALNVATKIAKGQIEIVSPVMVCAAGERVSPGAASLCQTMDIRPFTFGLKIGNVFNAGAVYSPEVLSMSKDDIANKFCTGVRNIAAVSLQIGYPTVASLPHSLSRALKHCIALIAGAKSEYKFDKGEAVLDLLAMDPEARAALAAANASSSAGGAGAAEEEKKEEEEEEEEAVAVGNMFGDDGGDDGW